MICKKCGHTFPDTENICPICCSPVERDGDQKYKRSKQDEKKGSGGIKKIKELPAKTKRTIIISAAFAAAVGLMLFLIFGVIIPAATPRTDISKNLTVVFDSKTQYDGSLSGDISLNREAAMKELSNEGLDEIVLTGVVDRLLYYADLEYKTQDGYSSGKSRNSVHFNDLGSTDEISVEITWPEDAESKENIAREEKASGITIDKSPKTIKVKLADYVKAYDIELKKANEVNVLDYINENDLIISVPVDSGITVGIDSFKTEIGGYVFENGSIYDTSVRVYNKNGELFSTVFFEFSETKDLKEGDTVTLSYSKNNRSADESGLLLKGEPVEYTVATPALLTAESAKSNPDAVKKYFNENFSAIDTDAEKNDDIEIGEIYFSENKKDRTFNKLVVVYENKSKSYFRTAELSRDGFFSGDRFVFYGYTELNEKAKSADDAVKKTPCLDSKSADYAITKVG